MAKYFQGESMVVSEFLRVPGMKPVVVIPEADWRRMVELLSWLLPPFCCTEDDCGACREDAELKGIIERTEAANG